MTQRRGLSGQGPSRRSSASARPTVRIRPRDTAATRVDPRAGAGRTRQPERATTGKLVNKSRARPAASRRSAATGEATKRTVATRPRAFTGRAIAIVVVLVTLALAYTYPVRTYLAQESQIARMEAAQNAQRAVIGKKAEEVAKWQDPEYIRIQARERLNYVRPGEVPLLVFSDPVGAARDHGLPPPVTAPDKWYDTLFSSVQKANSESQP